MRSSQPLLGLLLSLFAVSIASAAAPPPGGFDPSQASPEVSRVTDNRCQQQCEVERDQCRGNKAEVLLCEDRFRPCIERCDPQRLDRNSTMALYPASSRTVNGPRDTLSIEDQMLICRQQCGLSQTTCASNGNSNQGPGVMGAGNAAGNCQRAQDSCDRRCALELRQPLKNYSGKN